MTPSAGVLPVTASFDASSSSSNWDRPIVSYAWDFGDGTTGTGRLTTHTYTTPGVRYITPVSYTHLDVYKRQLQFHDQVCRSPGRRSDTSEHDVGALAGEGQLVFDEEFDTAPVSIDQVCHQRRDTSLPGPSFSRRGSMADGYHELLAETIRQVRLEH